MKKTFTVKDLEEMVIECGKGLTLSIMDFIALANGDSVTRLQKEKNGSYDILLSPFGDEIKENQKKVAITIWCKYDFTHCDTKKKKTVDKAPKSKAVSKSTWASKRLEKTAPAEVSLADILKAVQENNARLDALETKAKKTKRK